MKLNLFTRYSIRTSVMLLLVLLQFCKSEKEVNPVTQEVKLLTGGTSKTWTIASIHINGNEQALNPCEQATEITFSADLTGTNKFINTNCTVSSAFTWEMKEGAVSLIANQSEPQVLQILALDENTFQYKITYAADLVYEFTLKAR